MSDNFKALVVNQEGDKFSREVKSVNKDFLKHGDVFVKVERPKEIEVQYETTQGETKTARLDGMESKCFQHELDHLEGITFNKRVSKLRWDMARKKQ